MVGFLKQHLQDNASFVELYEASDGICENNTKVYIDFDKFIAHLHTQKVFKGNTFSSCDTILLNDEKNHMIFVEFKDMKSITTDESLTNWWKKHQPRVYLKITDSILGLNYYLNTKCSISYDDFMHTSKSFFYVYKSETYKRKINNHLKFKFTRYDYLFNQIRTIECDGFQNFLEKNTL